MRQPVVNVTVNTPPADAADAARLYGELAEKARAAVMRGVVQELGTDLKVRVIKCAREGNFDTNEETVRWVFAVNGAPFEIELTDDHGKVLDIMSRAIAVELLNALTQRVRQRIWP